MLRSLPYVALALLCLDCAGLLGFEDGTLLVLPDASDDGPDGASDAGFDGPGVDVGEHRDAREDLGMAGDASADALPWADRSDAGSVADAIPEAPPADVAPVDAGPPLLPDLAPCTSSAECTSGVCVPAGADADGDGFGSKDSIVSFCTKPPPGYVANRLDCCDKDPDARPGQTTYFGMPTPCGGYDWDCNGVEELYRPSRDSCDADGGHMDGWQGAIPPCGAMGDWVEPCGFCMCARASTAQQLCR